MNKRQKKKYTKKVVFKILPLVDNVLNNYKKYLSSKPKEPISKMKLTGCWNCAYLDYYEKDGFEDSSQSGYYCNSRDDEPHLKFKIFPSRRELKCNSNHKGLK